MVILRVQQFRLPTKLDTLKCEFISKDDGVGKHLPLKLALPLNLRKLTLQGCTISWENMSVIGSLPNLEVLKLRNFEFEGSVWEPNEGEFTKLKYLLIHISSLEQWHADYTHFPQLQHLCLSFCSMLEAIPPEFGDIASLETIELYTCSSSVVDSAMLIQEDQQNLGNEGFRVRVTSYSDYFHSKFHTSLRKVNCFKYLLIHEIQFRSYQWLLANLILAAGTEGKINAYTFAVKLGCPTISGSKEKSLLVHLIDSRPLI
ncbi:hypothetical protein Sango_2769500 [Sesamum angolense]|uniref:Uncharacterized protein n=1 Tax=Sesamum angolense TaxID=2727404 RepID=A0AAE1T8L8_9LAMI|nr:hypothetical protein Sango_2769500 [Sesamum angolense]